METTSSDIIKTTKALSTLPDWTKWLGRGLVVLFVVVLGIALIARLNFFADKTAQWLTYPFFRTGSSEGLMLSEIAMVRQGHSIYVSLQPDLFISAPYPPLYYYLVAWLWSPTASVAQGFETGRIISLVAAFVIALCVGLTAMLDSGRLCLISTKLLRWQKLALLLIGLVGAALFLSMPAVAVWATRVRADMLMVALQMLGLTLVAWKPRGWGSWVAILPFVLAIYTKQTALAGPLAALLFIVLQNWPHYKRIVSWLGLLITANLVPLLIINVLTGGEFWRRLFKYHNLGWQYSNFSRYFGWFVQENAAVLVASAALLIAVVVKLWLERQTEVFVTSLQKIPLSLWYLLLSLPFLLEVGVVGGDHNHFLPAEAATCCAGATLLGWAILQPAPKLKAWLTLGALGLLIWQAMVCAMPDARYEIEFRQYKPDEQAQLSRIIKLTATNPASLLTTEAGFFPLTGKAPNYDDFFTLTALVQQNLYDQTGLLERVRHKEFGIVLAPPGDLFNSGVRGDLWTPELLAALQANYQLKYPDVWFVYVPK